MPAKLIVFAHGIGNSEDGFHQEWLEAITDIPGLSNLTVKGLLWEDVLEQVATKYPVVSTQLAELVKLCGSANLEKFVGNKDWETFRDYMMDVLVYAGLSDMWLYIQNECALKLAELRKGADGQEKFKRSETILIGHSLGSAMLPQLAWREAVETGDIPYHGMILLASPLGFESPYPNLCKDFLQRMGAIAKPPITDRRQVLREFARAWAFVGEGRLRFISNENDIVCSDAKYELPLTGERVDLIPLRQQFDPFESHLLEEEHPGSVQWVRFGTPEPAKIAANHDVFTYLKQDAFKRALRDMLA